MNQKNLIATIYIKNGEAVKSFQNMESAGDALELVQCYNDSGIDRIVVFDLSSEDVEHEVNIHAIKEINRVSELPVYAGGNLNRMEDIKKLLYTGCKKVILNSLKENIIELAKDCAQRFGQDKIAMSLYNVDILFKEKETIESYVSELVILDKRIIGSIGAITPLPYIALYNGCTIEEIEQMLLKESSIQGISGSFISNPNTDIMALKARLTQAGIDTSHFHSNLTWADMKVNESGMVPVIVQDYQTKDVLMLAYMNEQAFETTLALGKMTYWSRSRNELWTKGLTSGHVQYVKSLAIDCDNDTILANVSQVGAACHTGNRSCFYRDLIPSEDAEKNPLKVLEKEFEVIKDRKEHPKEGSYTNYLFEKGLDKILKKIGEEATEIVIAAKNPDNEEVKYEMADFLYHAMVLMAEKGLSWSDITEELSQR